jgi:hypothetical protein
MRIGNSRNDFAPCDRFEARLRLHDVNAGASAQGRRRRSYRSPLRILYLEFW